MIFIPCLVPLIMLTDVPGGRSFETSSPSPSQPFAPPPFAIQTYAGRYLPPPVAGSPTDRSALGDAPKEHRFSLMLSVVHPLVFSMYDASGEFRLSRFAGLALVAGVGTASLKQFYKSLPDERSRVWAAGLQARFYPVGSFDRGLQVGAEIVYLTGSASTNGTITSDDDPPIRYTGPLTASGGGFKGGPFVGYKLALPEGFTVAAQIGVDYLSLKGMAKGDNGVSRSSDTKTALPLADATIGWSF